MKERERERVKERDRERQTERKREPEREKERERDCLLNTRSVSVAIVTIFNRESVCLLLVCYSDK